MTTTSSDQHDVRRLQSRLEEMREAIRLLEEERYLLRRRRRRNAIIVGVSLSIMVHVGLMLYLNSIIRDGPGTPAAEPVTLQFAVIHDQALSRLQDLETEELVPEVPWEFEDLSKSDPSASLDPDITAASLDVSAAGSIPALGASGAGEDGESTLGGGGAGASFFGVSSRGTRFAYIVDVSGSMQEDRKLDVCMRELARSVQSLPDYASFLVVLYSTEPRAFHNKWARARATVVSTLIRWLNQVDPSGGTRPAPAFEIVFDLRERPDVIFFLTDGLIPGNTPEFVAELNNKGRKVTINCIGFGTRDSQGMLQELSRASGGTYRFVPQ